MFQYFRNMVLKLFGSKPSPATKPVADWVGSYGEVFSNHLLFHLYTLIHEAFKVKSAGGRDRFGISWKDLKPASKDARFPRPIPGRVRGNLTKEQDKLWRKTFASLLASLSKKGIDQTKAKGIAAGYAWIQAKNAGAVTRKELYGKKKVELLKVSGKLMQSMAPGQLRNGKYTTDSQYQIAEVKPQGWKIGSTLPYFDKQNAMRTIIPLEKDPAFPKLLEEATQRATLSAAKEMQRRK